MRGVILSGFALCIAVGGIAFAQQAGAPAQIKPIPSSQPLQPPPPKLDGASKPAPRAPVQKRNIRLVLDETIPLELNEPVRSIIVGNPNFITISTENEKLLFLTGKAFGTTNLILLGEGGRTIFSGRVSVSPNDTEALVITRGQELRRYSCTPVCRRSPDAGEAIENTQTENSPPS